MEHANAVVEHLSQGNLLTVDLLMLGESIGQVQSAQEVVLNINDTGGVGML